MQTCMAGATEMALLGACGNTLQKLGPQAKREPNSLALFCPTVSHTVVKVTPAPLIFRALWALLLAFDQAFLATQPQVLIISVKHGFSCASKTPLLVEFTNSLTFSSVNFFFFLWCCLSLCGTEFSNHVIYQVPTLCHIEGLVIDTFALTSACTVVFSVCSPVFGCV